MIYAKCIRKTQICKTKKEYEQRKKTDEHHLYCEGETTTSNIDNLYKVPLCCIYDCLKYGDYIAVLEYSDDLPYKRGTTVSLQSSDYEQTTKKIFKADSKEAIDFLFQNVEDKNLIHNGYVNEIFMSLDNVRYFKRKMIS